MMITVILHLYLVKILTNYAALNHLKNCLSVDILLFHFNPTLSQVNKITKEDLDYAVHQVLFLNTSDYFFIDIYHFSCHIFKSYGIH